jgi:hypothetical protein
MLPASRVYKCIIHNVLTLLLNYYILRYCNYVEQNKTL